MSTQAGSLARARAVLDSVLIALFLGAILAPTIDERFFRSDGERGPAPELREPAPRPPLALDAAALNDFPELYEAYYDDSFGLRDKLLRWHSIAKLDLLGVSPTEKTFLGRDGWVFYAGDRSVEAWRGLIPFSEPELDLWQAALERHRDLLRDLGIEYLFAIAPNKESIYPERMPARLNAVGPTRLDQLAGRMRARSDVPFLDLRPAMMAEKRDDRPGGYLYFEEGTHWNGRGSWLCARELLSALRERFPSIVPPALADLRTFRPEGHGDTWLASMYLGDRSGQVEVLHVPPHPPRARSILETEWGPGRRHVLEVADPALPRAMLMHDSFGPYVEMLLAEHFSRLTCEWRHDFEPAGIEAEKPDVVIELFVERALVNLSPGQLQPSEVDPLWRAFRRSKAVLFALDPSAEPPQVRLQGAGARRRLSDDSGSAVEIRTASPADLVVLPAILVPESSDAVAWIDLTTPAATTLVLFFKPDPAAEFDRQHAVQVELSAGRNRKHFRFAAPAARGPIALRPGTQPGTYLLRAFEVRAVPGR